MSATTRIKKQHVVRSGMLRTLKEGVDLKDYLARAAERGETVEVCKTQPPTLPTLMRWSEKGIAKATDGCKVEPDGVCIHGHHSWMLVLSYI